jgi:uncharacterized protein
MQSTSTRRNPIAYAEIPVADLERAIRFYEAVFGDPLERQLVDGYEMAFFRFADGAGGASGALAKGDVYVPSRMGAIVYFSVDSIDDALARAVTAGGEVLYAKKDVGDFGFVAELGDSEGNRIALHQARA